APPAAAVSRIAHERQRLLILARTNGVRSGCCSTGRGCHDEIRIPRAAFGTAQQWSYELSQCGDGAGPKRVYGLSLSGRCSEGLVRRLAAARSPFWPPLPQIPNQVLASDRASAGH